MLLMYRKIKQLDEIKLVDEFTTHDANLFLQEIRYIVSRGLAQLVIDISELSDLDPCGINFLRKISNFAERRNGWIALIARREECRKLTTEQWIGSRFTIYTAVPSALLSKVGSHVE